MAVAEGFLPSAAAAKGISSRRPNVRLKVKPAAEGHKFEKSAILFEKKLNFKRHFTNYIPFFKYSRGKKDTPAYNISPM